MKFLKRGLILKPQDVGIECSRLMCPTPILVNEDKLRLYLGFCDNNGISRPGYVELNANNPSEVTTIKVDPLLNLGPNGTFDDNGVCPTCILKLNEEVLYYYFAFQRLVNIPFYMFTGLATSRTLDSQWNRFSNVPILDRTNEESLMRSGAYVIQDNNSFKIYYPCGYEFINVGGKLVHRYQIHFAESNDPKKWPEKGTPVIRFKNDDEYGFGRPYVFKNKDTYIMLYSIRSKSLGYRLGYAESKNGINWERIDKMDGLDVGYLGEWDSEMLCYSSLITTANNTYLFYNGNSLGSTGFGYAELVED
jgi:predicted GH43/DUF377 family glycosyl hydrolase